MHSKSNFKIILYKQWCSCKEVREKINIVFITKFRSCIFYNILTVLNVCFVI